MKLSWTKTIGSFFLAGVLTAPAWAAGSAVPGTVNYVEGQVTIGSEPVDAQSIGSTILQPGQSLITDNGKAEILLTPGVFLRLDNASSARMLSAGLTNTQVALEKGRAMVEVAEIHHENNLRITEDGRSTELLKTGLYEFDAVHNQVRVFSGKAVVFDGDRKVTINGGHRVDFNIQGKLKAEEFDKKQYQQSDLYRWSNLRSSYLAEANVDAARVYVSNGYYGPGWFGAGWYWDPWYDAYTFIPSGGIFYSPFGWGFYSPLVVYRSPVFFAGPRYVHHFGPTFHGPVIVGRPPIGEFHSRPAFGGAYGRAGGFGHAGDFHGGAGGHFGARR